MAQDNPYGKHLAPANPYGGYVPIGDPDPTYQYKGPKSAAELEAQRLSIQAQQAKAPYLARNAAADVAQNEAAALIASQKADAARAEAKLATMAPNSDLHGEAYMQKYVPPQMQAMVRAYARGDLGSRAGGLSQSMLPYIQHAMNYDPTVSATTFPARVKMQSDLAGNQPNTLGGGLRAMEQMLFHGRDVLNNGAALNNYGPGFFGHVGNSIKTMAEGAADDPRLSAYNQSVNNYAPESQKGVAGSAGIGAERTERHDAYSPTLSQASRAAALQADATMAFDRTGAVNDQYKRLMGKDIVDLLSPDARKAYDQIMSGGYDANGNALHPAPGYKPGSIFNTNNGGGGNGSGGGGGNGGLPPSDVRVVGNSTGMVPDPDRQAVTDKITGMLNSGTPDDQILAFARGAGYSDLNPIQNLLDVRRKVGQNRFLTTSETALRPSNNQQSPFDKYGPSGTSPVGTYFTNAANALTGNFMDNLQADPAMARAALAGSSAANPRAALLGDLSGAGLMAAGSEVGAGAALARAGMSAANVAKFAPVAGDALYGGLSGAGAADDGNRLGGAVLGAGLGVGGGMFGRSIVNPAIGKAIGGIAAPAARYLDSRGVPLTVGQVVRNSGFLGKTVAGLEQAGTSIPGSGSVISSRYQDGLVGLNKAMFQEAADQAGMTASGDIGSAGAADLHALKRQAYGNALDGTSYQIDPQFGADLTGAVNAGRAIPGRVDSFNYVMDKHLLPNIDNTGAMSGNNMQDALRGLKIAARPASQGAGAVHPQDFSDALGGVGDAITGMVDRQNPGASFRLGQANTLNRYSSIIDDALNGAAKNRDELITPAGLNTAAVSNNNRYIGKIASAEGDRPFYDLGQAGQAVMGNVTPNSGTFDRIAAAKTAGMGLGLLTGAGGTGYGLDGKEGAEGGVGLTLGTIGLGALGGSRFAQRALVSGLLDRGAVDKAVGQAIVNNPRWLGMFGASLAPAASPYMLPAQ